MDLVNEYLKLGVEFAVHGHRHINHAKLSYHDLMMDLEEVIRVFKKNNDFWGGFRFPYLKYGKNSMAALKAAGFKWDSSQSVLWEVLDDKEFNGYRRQCYQNMLDQYDYKVASSCISLPRFYDGLLEVPVSLPDDDLLERIGLKDNKLAGKIWCDILRESHSRGEIFTLQLHPERIYMFKDSLESVIQNAKKLYPGVWISSLGNVYDWWREKNGFGITLTESGSCQYKVQVNCSPRATLLVRSKSSENKEFYGYVVEDERRFSLRSEKRPVVGIPRDSFPELQNFLKNEGFPFKVTDQEEECSVYLDHFDSFSEKDEMRALEIINTCSLPLIRFWRWPNGCKSALSITGDIDALTSIDYFLRFFGIT